jgi:hypothetical protein
MIQWNGKILEVVVVGDEVEEEALAELEVLEDVV